MCNVESTKSHLRNSVVIFHFNFPDSRIVLLIFATNSLKCSFKLFEGEYFSQYSQNSASLSMAYFKIIIIIRSRECLVGVCHRFVYKAKSVHFFITRES